MLDSILFVVKYCLTCTGLTLVMALSSVTLFGSAIFVLYERGVPWATHLRDTAFVLTW